MHIHKNPFLTSKNIFLTGENIFRTAVGSLEFWQGFGELRISVDRQGSLLGFGKFGASKRAWAPNALAGVSSRVGFWGTLDSRLRSGFFSLLSSSVSGLGSRSKSNTGAGS